MATPNPPVLNISGANYTPLPALAPKYGAERWNVGTALGAQQLGMSVVKIPPGKAAFPYHNHYAIEEVFYILEGNGDMIMDKIRFQNRLNRVILSFVKREVRKQLTNFVIRTQRGRWFI